MAKGTVTFALLLIVFGLACTYGVGGVHLTALIPAGWGVLLGTCGALAISPSERRRKIFMHIAVTLGLLGFLLEAFTTLRGNGLAGVFGMQPDRVGLNVERTTAVLLIIYVTLCVESFIRARRSPPSSSTSPSPRLSRSKPKAAPPSSGEKQLAVVSGQ